MKQVMGNMACNIQRSHGVTKSGKPLAPIIAEATCVNCEDLIKVLTYREFCYVCELSLRALVITEAELRLMASAAIIGDSNNPVIG